MDGTRAMAGMATGTVEPTARSKSAERSSDDVARFRRRTRRVLAIGVGICAVLTLLGFPYYTSTTAERLESPFHDWLKPSGPLGQVLGAVAFGLLGFLWLYPLRKRVRMLRVTGSLGRWLDIHIVVGVLVPLIAAVHAGWRFQGIIGIGYFCLLCVSVSGLFGRYLYAHLPRSRHGLELSLDELERRGDSLVDRIAEALGDDPSNVRAELIDHLGAGGARASAARALVGMLSDDLLRWRLRGRLRRRWARGANVDGESLTLAVRLAGRRIALEQRARMLRVTQRLFRYWHVAHFPIAVTGMVAVTVHVVLAVVLGVTWLR